MIVLRRHISILLILAVFSLMMHVGVYHGLDLTDDHAQEQEHDHIDDDTCIAGLAHASLSAGIQVPVISWIQIDTLIPQVGQNYIQNVLSANSGRAPPNVVDNITV